MSDLAQVVYEVAEGIKMFRSDMVGGLVNIDCGAIEKFGGLPGGKVATFKVTPQSAAVVGEIHGHQFGASLFADYRPVTFWLSQVEADIALMHGLLGQTRDFEVRYPSGRVKKQTCIVAEVNDDESDGHVLTQIVLQPTGDLDRTAPS